MAVAFLTLLAPNAGAVQTPGAAGLWDVAGTTLARPPALESGPTGVFWNPAAILGGAGLRVGLQTVQTPEALGMNALLAAVSRRIGRRVGVGILFGRVQVSDLARTTTSPISQPGDIPVYEQLAGLALGAEFSGVRAAAILRGHDARFDLVRSSGLTLDFGATAQPHERFRVAATSQFVPADFSNRRTERYFAGAEYQAVQFPAWGTPATVWLRYGVTLRDRRELEHSMGLGLGLGRGITLDSAFQYERAFGDNWWRFVLAIGLRAGRYSVLAARGGGIEGLGANYRVGLDVDLAK